MSKHSRKPTKKTNRTRRLTVTTVLVALVILAITAVAVASRQRAKGTTASEAAKSLKVTRQVNYMTVKVAGQDVQVDGQTGQMKPLTQEEAQKLAAGLAKMVNQSTEGLEQVQHEDGSVSMDLKGRFQNVTVARVNQDGSVTQSCVDNPQAAGAFFGIDPKSIEGQMSANPIDNQPNPKTVEKNQ